MGKSKHLLVGGSLVVGGRADSNDLASLNVGELELEGESVPVVTSAVGELELVSVFIEIVDAEDLSDDIEVFAGFLGTS